MNIIITRLTSVILRSLTTLDFETSKQKTLLVDRLPDVPAVRGRFVAFWSNSDEGTLTLADVTIDKMKKLTKVPYLGSILIHPKLDIVIALGHIPNGGIPRVTGRAGNLAEISMYDFGHDHPMKKIDPAEHDRVFQALCCDWYRDGILRYVHFKPVPPPLKVIRAPSHVSGTKVNCHGQD